MIALEVLTSGPLATVQDLGRPGLAHLGVTGAGPADRRSHSLANRLVANPKDRATIEITMGGFTARVRGGSVDIAQDDVTVRTTAERRSTGSGSGSTVFAGSSPTR